MVASADAAARPRRGSAASRPGPASNAARRADRSGRLRAAAALRSGAIRRLPAGPPEPGGRARGGRPVRRPGGGGGNSGAVVAAVARVRAVAPTARGARPLPRWRLRRRKDAPPRGRLARRAAAGARQALPVVPGAGPPAGRPRTRGRARGFRRGGAGVPGRVRTGRSRLHPAHRDVPPRSVRPRHGGPHDVEHPARRAGRGPLRRRRLPPADPRDREPFRRSSGSMGPTTGPAGGARPGTTRPSCAAPRRRRAPWCARAEPS